MTGGAEPTTRVATHRPRRAAATCRATTVPRRATRDRLRALAATPGRVLSRGALLRTPPRGADEHAVEMAVARLRAGLGAPGVIQMVVKRGYRVPVD
jgi:DNA-binding response OmpR family regulator